MSLTVIVLTISGILLTIPYLVFVLSVYTGLNRLTSGKNRSKPSVSVLVAARNEEDNIQTLMDSLLKQDYSKDLFEIIVVNDRSEDRTVQIVESNIKKHSNIKLINITKEPIGYSPKKHALSEGIKVANGEIICTTDADCYPGPAWISEIISYFEDEVGMVAGFSPLRVKNGGKFFTQYLFIDSLSLAIVTAGGLGWGTGWTCNGRNFAYRKELFADIGGYDDLMDQISGDDDLLMYKVQKKTNWKLRYAFGETAIVESSIKPGLGNYANMRTRHASKFRVHPFHVKVAAISIFLFYLSMGIYPVIMLSAGLFLPVYMIMMAGKFFAEFITMKRGSKKLGVSLDFIVFLKAFFIHPFLIVLLSIRGAQGKFTWKGRSYVQK